MTPERTRPGGIWAVSIFAITLGALGTCGGAFGAFGLAFQETAVRAQQDMTRRTEQDPVAAEINIEMQERTLEVGRRYRVPQIAVTILNVLASLLLAIGGVLLLLWRPQATTIFFAAVALSIVVDLASGGLGIWVQQETMSVMQESMQRLAEHQGDPEAGRLIGGITQASGSAGLCFAIFWMLAKIGGYLGSVFYLRKPDVQSLF